LMPSSSDTHGVLLRVRARGQPRALNGELAEDGVGIPRGHRDDAFAIVGHDIQAEPKAGTARDLAHRLVERVAFDLREAYAGILEEAHSVRRRDHRLAGTPDRYGLAAPGISRVLVWLDNPSRDDEVRLLDELLRGARHVVGRNRPKVGPHRGIAPAG